jgi:hypothetical protein
MSTQTYRLTPENTKEFVAFCIEQKLTKSDVKAIIASNNLPEEQAKKVFYQFCCELSAKMGWKMIGIGGFLLLIAFFVPFLIDYANPLFNISLYGFTSAGGVLSMFGLYKIIG